MSDIVKRLCELAQAKHDDLSVGDEAAAEINRLRADLANARNDVMEQLERYFRDAAARTPLGYEDHQRGASVYNWLMYCVTTIAAIRSNQRLERVDLGASQSAADLVATARREGMEMPPEFLEWMKREMPSGTHIHNPEWWASRVWKAAIRAAAKEEQ